MHTAYTPTVDHATSTARNADLQSLFGLLTEADARRVDIVTPATSLVAHKGNLIVRGAAPVLSADGVTSADGVYRPNTVGVEGIAEKTGIPVKYLRTLHSERPDLFDANVNGWLRGGIDRDHVVAEPDARSFMVRTYKPADDGQPGIMRALLSDRYAVMDNLDILASVLDGVRASGIQVEVSGADLTERRMRVRIKAPQIQALAPTLLAGYRSPFTGLTGAENPVMFAGLEISNSEVGSGAFTIVPRLEILVCNNGMRRTVDAVRNVHLGGRLEAGVVRWSSETQERNTELVRSQTTDAVRTFLNVSYMESVIADLSRKADQPVASEKQVREVTKASGVTQAQIEDIMGFFVTGGQPTRMGVANAITAYAQTVADGDTAADLEDAAMAVLA